MRILAISSQVAHGPVGLTAAVPPLQARGHEVLPVPTITLSNHPGHGRPAGFRTQPDDLARMLETLAGLGALEGLDAVLTGYFAAPEQVDAVEPIVARLKARFVLVDPVIGDEGGLYVPQPVAEAIRGKLVPLATCITPNRFELEWLSGLSVTGEESAIAAARTIGTMEVLATSIPHGDDHLATLLVTLDAVHRHIVRRRLQVPHGTGDMLSGLYLGFRVAMPAEHAFHKAMAVLDHAIAISAGTSVLNVAGTLSGS
jgi:pyridoxine kinase